MDFVRYCEREINETLKRKVVIRDQKRVVKYVSTDPEKYDVVKDENGNFHEVPADKSLRRKKHLIGDIVQKRVRNKGKNDRKRSFMIRKKLGLKYNKKLPDLVLSRGPGGHVPGGPVSEQFINESPHCYLFTDNHGYDYFWDFYSEIFNDTSWLCDVVDIFEKHEITTVPGGMQQDEIETLEIPPEAIPQIIDNMMGIEFLTHAAKDYVRAPQDIKERFRNGIPAKLFNALKPYINTMERKTPLSDYMDDGGF